MNLCLNKLPVSLTPGRACQRFLAALCKAVYSALLIASLAPLAHAQLDLRNATVERFDNGFTLIMLPDYRFPVASVQMLYRVGARDEVSGKTGLAHFLEHMAFRETENFPNTDVVSRIYAVGGEWHGYTWIDQTTYYATVPSEHLDLLLQIEADRMRRLAISAEAMEAERGSVLAEMHMYENSPVSQLIDAVNYSVFLAHPYRNNTIGWESDIENLQHSDVVAFYQQHYQPANAVLAVVGSFDGDKVRSQVAKLFGSLASSVASPVPHTTEPVQNGLRRVTVNGTAEQRQFMIAYRAPAVTSADFAPFLVLQEILGSGSGVNFRQNDWGTAVDGESSLAGAAESVTTWFPPSAQDYVFIVGGVAPEGDDESSVEQRIEARISQLRQQAPAPGVLQKAVSDVQDALVFDVQTTEDAAHQLAFFDGLNALETLLELPERVAAVSAADVQRVAVRYLGPRQRSIAWYLPAVDPGSVATLTANPTPVTARVRPIAPAGGSPTPAPINVTLSGGIPVIVQRSDFSATAQLQIVLPSNQIAGAVPDAPIQGVSSISYDLRPRQVADTIVQAHEAVAALKPATVGGAAPSSNPATRLEQVFDGIMQVEGVSPAKRFVPSLITVVGDIDVEAVLAQLEKTFGGLKYQAAAPPTPRPIAHASVVVTTGKPLAQAQLGYIAAAPGPRDSGSEAWRLLLYILSHDYEGRLGKKAISQSGLAYHIDSAYRSDGRHAWITLSTGVDPDKTAPLRELLASELERLVSEPPTPSEIDEAKNHRLGRLVSAAQSNSELATRLASQWLWYGEIQTVASLRERLAAISRQDVLDITARFVQGKTILVTE